MPGSPSPRLPAAFALASAICGVLGSASLFAAPVAASHPAPISGAASQWLPWAKDELQEPKLFQSINGVLDVLMVAHEAGVGTFAPFRTNGWTYTICPRPATGEQCPKGTSASNEYGGTRLQVEPGDTLRIRLVNRLPIFTLPIDPDAPIRTGMPIDPGARGRSQNPTSLHTHGLLVSPHYALPGQSTWGDNPFAHVFNLANGRAPDFEKMMGPVVYDHINYEYDIPTSHPSGLFWFHPHTHGLTQAQINSGLSGVLTIGHVADEVCGDATCASQLAQVPERTLLLKDTQIEPDATLARDQDTGFCAIDDKPGSTSPSHEGGCDGTSVSPVSGLDHTGGRWIYSINGQVFPSITVGMPTGQVWRIVNASGNTTYDLSLWLPDERREMQVQVLSVDGVSVGTSGKGVTQPTACRSPFGAGGGMCTTRIHIMPAMRAEIFVAYRDATGAIKPTPAPVNAVLRTPGYVTGPSGDNFPAIDLAKVQIATGQVDMQGDGKFSTRIATTARNDFPNAFTQTTLPATPVCGPLPPGHMRRIFLNTIDDKLAPFGLGYDEVDEHGREVRGSFVDVRHFDHMDTPLCLQLQPGNQPEVERWQLVNLAGEDHSFHVHQVRFSVINAPTVDGTVSPKRIGLRPELVDSIALPHADGDCGSVNDWVIGKCTAHVATIEIPFQIAGEFLFHCHVLEHEDGGMMAGIRVLANDAPKAAKSP